MLVVVKMKVVLLNYATWRLIVPKKAGKKMIGVE